MGDCQVIASTAVGKRSDFRDLRGCDDLRDGHIENDFQNQKRGQRNPSGTRPDSPSLATLDPFPVAPAFTPRCMHALHTPHVSLRRLGELTRPVPHTLGRVQPSHR